MTVVSARGLSVSVRGTPLIDEVDLDVADGEWVSIIGPNGAGKSTLLRALAGVARPEGSLEVGGVPSTSLAGRQRARTVSWVPQVPTVPAGMRVLDYVLLGRTPHLHPLATETRADVERVGAVLAELDLSHLSERLVDTLSGGERQRTVIARALVQDAPLMLLDEPTSALDLGHQQDVLELLDRLRGGGARTIVSTMHDLTLAGQFADRLVLMAEGRVVAEGPAGDVLTEDRVARHYGADVRIEHIGEAVVVVPRPRRPNSNNRGDE